MKNKEVNVQTKKPYVIFIEGNDSQPKKLVTKVKDLIREEITDLIKQEFSIFEKILYLSISSTISSGSLILPLAL